MLILQMTNIRNHAGNNNTENNKENINNDANPLPPLRLLLSKC
jgi:hypothetical protein